MYLYNLKETSEKTGVGRATIYRFYEKNPDLWSETKIKNKKRLIPHEHLSLITKTDVYTKVLRFEEQNAQLKRLVELLVDSNTIQYRLYQMDWDWFGTVAFRNDFDKKSSFHQMLQAFDYIITMYGSEIDLRMFFCVEPFMTRDGTHIHFILKVGKGLLTDAVIAELKGFFKGNRLDFRKYDRYKAGVYYLAKKGLQGEDWDILGNDLKTAVGNNNVREKQTRNGAGKYRR